MTTPTGQGGIRGGRESGGPGLGYMKDGRSEGVGGKGWKRDKMGQVIKGGRELGELGYMTRWQGVRGTWWKRGGRASVHDEGGRG